MSGHLAIRNEARARLWERGLTFETLSAEEWIAAVDDEVRQLTAPGLVDDALATLEAEASGLMALQGLSGVLISGRAFQLVHKTKRVGEFRVGHERDGCWACDTIELIERALWSSHDLARRVIADAVHDEASGR